METTSKSYHINLANYFACKSLYLDEPIQKKPNTRKLVELPWQELEAAKIVEKQFEIDSKIKDEREKYWDNVTNTLCNLDFIQAKAAAKMTYELVNDFNAALKVIPDNAETIGEEKEWQARMDKYTNDLIACAKGEITTEELEIPKSIIPWTTEQCEKEIGRIKTSPTKVDLLKDFLNFLGNESSNLQNYANEFAHFTHQQAWNYAADGPVGIAAGELKPAVSKSLMRHDISTRPCWNPIPQVALTLTGHTSGVVNVTFTPDGKWAFSGSWDKTCILWDLKTGQPVKTFRHTSGVNAVSITPDGSRALSSSNDDTCIVWDLDKGQAIKTLTGHNAISITPDGRRAVLVSLNKTCILWDLETGQATTILTGLKTISIAPDGKWVIIGSDDMTWALMDLHQGEVIKTLKPPYAGIISVAISLDGKLALAGTSENKCVLWDLSKNKVSKTFKGPQKFWDSAKGKRFQTLKANLNYSSFIRISVTPNFKLAVSSPFNNTIILWDITTGKELQFLNGHTDLINAVSISPDGQHAISSSNDNTCILWNLKKASVTKPLLGHASSISTISISKDGKKIITGCDDESCFLWDLTTGEDLHSINLHAKAFSVISFSPDEEKAISSYYRNSCILWDINTGKKLITYQGHKYPINSISIAKDGKRMITGSNDRTCIIWDLATGKILQTLIGHTDHVTAVSISPDGEKAISGSRDTTIIIWNLNTGGILKILKGHSNTIKTLSITPDGKKVISGSLDNTCIVWDIITGNALKKLEGHSMGVTAVTITPDSERAISCSLDKTSIIWDLNLGIQLARLATASRINTVAYFSNKIYLGCKSGELILLDVDKALISPGIAVCTAAKVWNFNLQQYQDLSVNCPLCGYQFSPQSKVIASIKRIGNKAGLRIKQYSCLVLPSLAWEDPDLSEECPECHEKLKFNPFIAGVHKSKSPWKFWKR